MKEEFVVMGFEARVNETIMTEVSRFATIEGAEDCIQNILSINDESEDEYCVIPVYRN